MGTLPWSSKRLPKHVWVYDDTVMVGPLCTFIDDDGSTVNIWKEINSTNRGLIVHAKGGFIVVKRDIWTAIDAWASGNRFGDMPLHEYLNKMFGVKL